MIGRAKYYRCPLLRNTTDKKKEETKPAHTHALTDLHTPYLKVYKQCTLHKPSSFINENFQRN
jgi:hypothetical protein